MTFLLPYEYRHTVDSSSHYPPEMVVILGHCNIRQFIEAVDLLGFNHTVNHDRDIKEAMIEFDELNPWMPKTEYKEILDECPPYMVFGFIDVFDHKPAKQHVYDNIYGVVQIKED